MFNIIKSQNYSLRRDLMVVLTILTAIALPFLGIYFTRMMQEIDFSNITGSMYHTLINEDIVAFNIFIIMIFAAKTVGGDSSDKTINYELMNGHSREKVFFARVINGFFWSVIFVMITIFLPYVVVIFINGWGDNCSLNEMLIRNGLLFFPILRLSALFMLITVLADSCGAGIGVSYLIVLIETVFDSVLDGTQNKEEYFYFLSLSNLTKLAEVNNSWQTVKEGRVINWFDFSTNSEMVRKTCYVSLIMAAIYIIGAYLYFKKKDKG